MNSKGLDHVEKLKMVLLGQMLRPYMGDIGCDRHVMENYLLLDGFANKEALRNMPCPPAVGAVVGNVKCRSVVDVDRYTVGRLSESKFHQARAERRLYRSHPCCHTPQCGCSEACKQQRKYRRNRCPGLVHIPVPSAFPYTRLLPLPYKPTANR